MTGQLDLLSWTPPARADEKVVFPPIVHDLLPDILLAAWRKRGTTPARHEAEIVELHPRPQPNQPRRKSA